MTFLDTSLSLIFIVQIHVCRNSNTKPKVSNKNPVKKSHSNKDYVLSQSLWKDKMHIMCKISRILEIK
jgi:hypothetical protein